MCCLEKAFDIQWDFYHKILGVFLWGMKTDKRVAFFFKIAQDLEMFKTSSYTFEENLFSRLSKIQALGLYKNVCLYLLSKNGHSLDKVHNSINFNPTTSSITRR
jgi:hypothetical protein